MANTRQYVFECTSYTRPIGLGKFNKGLKIFERDTGLIYEWTGSEWVFERRPYRVVGSNDVEVAGSRFANLEDALKLVQGMNDLKENYDNKRCPAPYRVQELTWKDVG